MRTMISIGLCPRDSSNSLISLVVRLGVPAFRPPVLCPRAIYSRNGLQGIAEKLGIGLHVFYTEALLGHSF